MTTKESTLSGASGGSGVTWRFPPPLLARSPEGFSMPVAVPVLVAIPRHGYAPSVDALVGAEGKQRLMCCGGSPIMTLPGPVAEMLIEYRQLAGVDWLWGENKTHSNAALLAQLRFVGMTDLMTQAFARVHSSHPERSVQELIELALDEDPSDLLRAALGKRVPPGLVVLRLDEEGYRLEHSGCRPVISRRAVAFSLLVDSARSRRALVTAPRVEVQVDPGAAALVELEWKATSGCPVDVDGRRIDLGSAFSRAELAHLRVRAPYPVRWSVLDCAGGGWFPDGFLHKWDYHQRPFFHGADLRLDVPAALLSVTARRGMEFGVASVSVEARSGEETVVALDPSRRFDPAASGWFGGDLHVHMNYAGDQVCSPDDAARMQHGEGLHLVNLVAGNCTTSRVFDRQALETWAGEDLPWSGEAAVARMGVEYRNDLLGHFHALNPVRAPSAYYSGHAGSDRPEDWPPNSVAARELRRLGATVGYCHPVLLPMEDDPSFVFDLEPRSVEAREVVVDAALGLVDSLDVLSNMNGPGAAVLYRRLVGAGQRLAVTAGTDCFLSFSRCATFSNPPGWARAYARVDGALTVAGYQEAIRAGRTLATNGPWLELDVAGQGPGDVIDVQKGSVLKVTARVFGPGVDTLRLLVGEGELASMHVDADEAVLCADLVVDEPTYVVAEASGGTHPEVLAQQTFAHTSALYVEVMGRRVACRADAAWCIDWIDRLERLARRAGTFSSPGHLDDLLDVLDQARAVYRRVG